MSNSAEIELTYLKEAINYLAAFLEEGSLVEDRYDKTTREAIALVLGQLVSKVETLPEGVPDHLVQAVAVRAIIGASDQMTEAGRAEVSDELKRRMRDAEAAASVKGCILGQWELVSDAEMEYQATCDNCGGFVHVSPADIFDLLPPECSG